MNSNIGSGGMDFMQMMQSQIITMTGLKDGGNMTNAIFGIIILTLFNNLMNYVPIFFGFIKNMTNKYFEKKKDELENRLKLSIKTENKDEKKITGKIIFEKPKNNPDNIIIQSLMNFISNLKSSEEVLYNNDFYVINKKEFLLEPEIYCNIIEYNRDGKGTIDKYNFEIYSYVYDINKLKNFVNIIVNDYKQEMENKLGNKNYFFNEFSVKLNKSINGGYDYSQANSNLIFTMIQFNTNKSLNNIFGTHLDVLKKRIEMFINNPLWYEKKGIPYTLGILLSGPPGTGKTSAIKAIAKDTNRHIFNINFKETTTQTQMNNLFYNTDIRVLKNGATEILNIPLNKRIYVIEDIDALSDVVLKRDNSITDINEIDNSSNESLNLQNTNNLNIENENKNEPSFDNMQYSAFNDNGPFGSFASFSDLDDNNNQNINSNNIINNNTNNGQKKNNNKNDQENTEKITLSYLLNLFDGVLETPGRILIMTSNHPEKLDPALIRPGRIDINLKVDYCTKDMIYDMYNFFYDKNDIKFDFNYNNNLTPAKVSSILQNNFDNPKNGINELIKIANQ